MASRATVLFLSQCLPYPPHTGVTNRTCNLLKQLHREFDVILLAYYRVNHQPTPEARQVACQALAQFVTEVCQPVPIPAERSLVRRAWDHWRSLSANRAYTYYEYASDHFRDRLRAVLSRRSPDLVHIDSLDLHRWLCELPLRPQVCTHHNIESQLLRVRAARVRSPIVAWYAGHQANLIERLERRVCAQFELNVTMSDLDAERLKRIAPTARTIVVPNGVDTGYFQPRPSEAVIPGRVVFLGPMYMFPNRDAMDYCLREIWPIVRQGYGSATLQVIGACSQSQRERYEQAPGVTCLGYVEDIRRHLAEASCCIVPIRVGGGTRLKILDSWAMGRAVVSTSLGCEGLRTINEGNIVIRDDARGFAAAVLEVLSDPRMRARLESGARRTAEELYSWDRVGDTLRAAYRHLLGVVPATDTCNS